LLVSALAGMKQTVDRVTPGVCAEWKAEGIEVLGG